MHSLENTQFMICIPQLCIIYILRNEKGPKCFTLARRMSDRLSPSHFTLASFFLYHNLYFVLNLERTRPFNVIFI